MSSKLLTRKRTKQSSTSSVTSPGGSALPDTPPREQSPGAPTSASTPSDSSSVPQNVSDAFAQVHPSLVEYLSLFPSSTSFAVVDPPQSGDGLNMTPTSAIAPQAPVNFSQTPAVNGANPSPAYPNFFDMSHNDSMQGVKESAPHANEPLNFLDPTMAALSMPELGFTEDVMMTEHWMNLMRETGILDSNGNYAGMAPANGQQSSFMPQQNSHPSF